MGLEAVPMSVAVLVNGRSRHGSSKLGARLQRAFPEARVVVTHSLEDARIFLADSVARGDDVLLSAGGDGTAVAVLNELRAQGAKIPTFGLLPVGTGNGWARATGAVGTRAAVRGLRALRNHRRPPLRTFDLVEVEGKVTPFAGFGWDADILSDYAKAMADVPARLRPYLGGTKGYLHSLFTRSLPRHLFGMARPNVRVVNLGEDAWVAGPGGVPTRIPNAGPGTVLYEGPLSVGGAATTEELGLGFRAFPFAHAVPGRICVRVYAAPTWEATLAMRKLWRGEAHPLANDHHFFVEKCRFEFDRPVPFEVGGDLGGERTSLEFSRHPTPIPLVDFRKLGRG